VAVLLGGCRCCTGLARRREDRERRSENGALGFARREPAVFCSPGINARSSNQILRLTTTGLERGPGGQRLSRPRPRLWLGARWCAMREWALGPILSLGCFHCMNSKEIDFLLCFKYCPHMQRN
jgi:hypothetical protein